MKALFFVLLIITSALASTRCTVETAQANPNKKLIIASDYLTQKDTVLFKDFIEEHQLDLIIRNMEAIEIISLYQNAGYNSGIDVVLLESINDVLLLNKATLFHPLKFNKAEAKYAFSSERFNYIGFAIDPYIISKSSDSLPTKNQISKLLDTTFHSSLSQGDFIHMFSNQRSSLARMTVAKQVTKWLSLHQTYRPTGDSLSFSGYAISKLSEQPLLSIPEHQSSFLLKNTGDHQYTIRTACIVTQASNYVMASSFIDHLLNPGYNDQLNKTMNTLPIYDYLKRRQGDFKLSKEHPDQVLQYHVLLDRMIQKIKGKS